MAREVILKVWCDPCSAEGVQSEAEEHTVGLLLGSVGPVQPKVLAMCPEHRKALADDLAAMVAEYGQEVDMPTQKAPAKKKGASSDQDRLMVSARAGIRHGKPPSGPRLNECLWCELTYAGDGGGFHRHLKVIHGFTGFTEAFGGLCPVCGQGPYDLMNSHVRKSHPELDFVGVSEPFTWARDNGDPHGQYAERLARTGSMNPEEAKASVRKREKIAERARRDADQPELEPSDG